MNFNITKDHYYQAKSKVDHSSKMSYVTDCLVATAIKEQFPGIGDVEYGVSMKDIRHRVLYVGNSVVEYDLGSTCDMLSRVYDKAVGVDSGTLLRPDVAEERLLNMLPLNIDLPVELPINNRELVEA